MKTDNEYILRTKKRWLKNKITAHWQSLGKVVVFVYRDFSTKTVTIDYCGGPSTKYTYDGKWICG